MTKPDGTFGSLLKWLFDLSTPVSRRAYALAGVSLGLIKYATDAAAVRFWLQRSWSPVNYVSPFLRGQVPWGVGTTNSLLLSPSPSPLFQTPGSFYWAMTLWTLPFIWIGLAMTLRRLADARRSPWFAALLLVPAINYLLMLALCLLPTRPADPDWETDRPPPPIRATWKSALLGVAITVGLGLGMVLVTRPLHAYTPAMFLGTPVLMGLISGYLLNRGEHRSQAETWGVAVLAVVLASGAVLAFALEGLICILMALPLAIPASMVGAAIGRAIALRSLGSNRPQILAAMLLLPATAGLEARQPSPLLVREVVTSVEIQAPPETVWKHVVTFPDLPPPTEQLFRAGVAYPERARIEGHGVGAIRTCEFSTGPFVEPITAWDEPTRLSFDVTREPAPMVEWSPYRIHPPHLDDYFRSKRGEFRLTALPGGRTRLEGSTWYQLEIYPQAYWSTWADGIVHLIHRRVLEHIQRLSEHDAG